MKVLFCDDSPPKAEEIADYGAEMDALGLDAAALCLTHEGGGFRWRSDAIVETTAELRRHNVEPWWWLRVVAIPRTTADQLARLDYLLEKAAPEEVCLNAEWEWAGRPGDEVALEDAARCAKMWATWAVRHPGLRFSVTAHPSLKPHVRVLVQALLDVGVWVRLMPMSFIFKNPRPGHWSHNLSLDPDGVVERDFERWMRAFPQAAAYTPALAAHLQDDLPGAHLDLWRRCAAAAFELEDRDERADGAAWWSLRWVRKDPALITALQELGGDDFTPAPPAYHGQHDERRPTLRRGQRGDDVEALQEALADLGLLDDVDGVFGFKTDEAVEDFQRRSGLETDGVVGRDTWAELDAARVAGAVREAAPKPREDDTPRLGDKIDWIPVGGERVPGPLGLDVRWGVQFKSRPRDRSKVNSRLHHLNGGPGNPSAYFAAKGLGVHLFIELDGVVWVGGDLLDQIAHGGWLNSATIGLETRNGGRVFGPDGTTWAHGLQRHYIKARWAWGGTYCLPTPNQLYVLVALHRWLSWALPQLSDAWWGAGRGAALSIRRLARSTWEPGTGSHRSWSNHSCGVIEASYIHAVVERDMGHDEAIAALVAELSTDGILRHLNDIAPNRPFRPLGPKGAPAELRRPWATPRG